MSIIRHFYYSLPPSLRYVARQLASPAFLERQKYYNGIPLPKTGEIFTGRGNFLESGKITVDNLRRFAGLKGHSAVLDLGSGLGRVAIPLTDVLDEGGEYHGVDIVKSAIKRCQQEITKRYPHFHFYHTPVYNDLYNAGGPGVTDITLPFDYDSMDVAVANSFFTHLLWEETAFYLEKTAAFLKSGGAFYASFFILDEDNIKKATNAADQSEAFRFPYQDHNVFLMSQTVKRANVAYKKEKLFALLEDLGYTVENFFPGYWRGGNNQKAIDFQDILILKFNV
jgi:SAM-dependent methyltransferase